MTWKWIFTMVAAFLLGIFGGVTGSILTTAATNKLQEAEIPTITFAPTQYDVQVMGSNFSQFIKVDATSPFSGGTITLHDGDVLPWTWEISNQSDKIQLLSLGVATVPYTIINTQGGWNLSGQAVYKPAVKYNTKAVIKLDGNTMQDQPYVDGLAIPPGKHTVELAITMGLERATNKGFRFNPYVVWKNLSPPHP